MRFIVIFITTFFSNNLLAAQQIALNETHDFIKIKELAVSREQTHEVGSKSFSKKADNECKKKSKIIKHCYYFIKHTTGYQTDHERVYIEIYKD